MTERPAQSQLTQSPLTETAAFKLHRATILVDRLADAYLKREHDIGYAAYLVLLMVRLLGAPSQQAIAANLDVSRASITQRVAALVTMGLVAVAPDPDDSRANIVSLTESGIDMVDAAWRGLEHHQDGLDRGVDQVALAAQLDLIIANAETALAEVALADAADRNHS